MNSAQLVALRGSVDGSQPQLVAVQMEDGVPTSVTGASDLVISSADNTQLMYNQDISTGTSIVILQIIKKNVHVNLGHVEIRYVFKD